MNKGKPHKSLRFLLGTRELVPFTGTMMHARLAAAGSDMAKCESGFCMTKQAKSQESGVAGGVALNSVGSWMEQ